MELRGRVSVVTGQGPAWGWFVAEGMRAAGASVIAFDIVPGEGILAADVASERGRATVGEVAEAVAGAGVETTAHGSPEYVRADGARVSALRMAAEPAGVLSTRRSGYGGSGTRGESVSSAVGQVHPARCRQDPPQCVERHHQVSGLWRDPVDYLRGGHAVDRAPPLRLGVPAAVWSTLALDQGKGIRGAGVSAMVAASDHKQGAERVVVPVRRRSVVTCGSGVFLEASGCRRRLVNHDRWRFLAVRSQFQPPSGHCHEMSASATRRVRSSSANPRWVQAPSTLP